MLTAYRQMLSSAAGRHKLAWIGYPLVLLLADILRFWNLANPHALVFDETYYVKDAFTLSQAGVELSWPEKADKAFLRGNVFSFDEDQAAFVVHPPLGKWLISIGMSVFGAANSFAWRFSAALFGTVLVGLVMLVAWQLMRSVTWSLAAGFLLAIDGHAIVLARTALLDGFLATFAVLAFYLLLRDRESVRLRIIREPNLNLIWRRPWLVACALALGAATAVKWSGLWFALAFGAYVCVSEGIFRHRFRQASDSSLRLSVIAAAKQTLVNFVLMVPIFLATYLASWSGWLLSDRGYDANWAKVPANQASGWLAWVPEKIQSLWHYHEEAYRFHVGLHSPHSYASSPLTWLIPFRPTSFYYEGNDLGENGCEFDGGCSAAITALGNVAIWVPALAALIWLSIRYLRHRESVPGLILMGMVAGYLPWLLFLNRTVFQFYAITFLPWMILALVFALRAWLRGVPKVNRERREPWMVAYLAFAAALSIFFYPIWTAMQVPYWFWYWHMWLPSWI